MKTFSLQFKVLLIAAAALAVALGAALLTLSSVYDSIQELDRVTHEEFRSQRVILQATVAYKQRVQEWKDTLLKGADPASAEKQWSAFLKEEKHVQDLVQEARAANRNADVMALLDKFAQGERAAGERYRQAFEVFKASAYQPRVGDGAVENTHANPAAILIDAAHLAEDHGAHASADAVSRARSGYYIAIGATVVSMLGALTALWLFVRHAVLQPIGRAVGHAERIAQGDLTAEIHSGSRDEAGQLLGALGRMNDGLSQVVTEVRRASEAVVTAADEVAAGTTDLSQRTEEQATSLEETAASMEELAVTVRQNAENARQADELARNASRRAEQGGAEVVRVVERMTDIATSASRIADIISVIDGIAFQTNILALNAAVEAARAGEQGRGFAVVAAEVRSLAQRSADAAKEIKMLIGESVDKARKGTELVEQAGDTIQALVVDVQRVSDLMASIAQASAEQSRGVQQVNKTVTEMDKVVQQNASAVQQSASAAEAMKQEAEALVRAVSAFRVGQAPAGAASRAPRERVQDRSGSGSAPPPAPVDAPKAVESQRTPALVGSDEDWQEF
ncbi:MAG TPA: methyl-accepting chemotaxis protein [Usitatibacter sp.]|jgi:methyl-accepting chemotaxis protein|nr:methyl-accepting chemotaxis protein [Usitatibacter sp.]